MKVLVAVKRVVDYQVNIRVKADGSGIEKDHVKMSMNPFDEIAMEEAVRWREQGAANEIIAASIGAKTCDETLRHALALGADRAIRVDTEASLSSLSIAKILQVVVQQEQPDIVLLGKQAIDNDCNQTGQMLAGLLNWSQGTFVSEITIDDSQLTVVREVDGGLETLNLKLPAVITTDLRLNEPRYVSLPNIMKAKSKPLAVKALDDLNLTMTENLKRRAVTPPEKRQAGIMVEDFSELMMKLKNEAKVLS